MLWALIQWLVHCGSVSAIATTERHRLIASLPAVNQEFYQDFFFTLFPMADAGISGRGVICLSSPFVPSIPFLFCHSLPRSGLLNPARRPRKCCKRHLREPVAKRFLCILGKKWLKIVGLSVCRTLCSTIFPKK